MTDPKVIAMLSAMKARRVIARQLAHSLINENSGEQWDNYPEIGEFDWETIANLADRLIIEPTQAEYEAAYTFLANRSDPVA